MKDSGNFDLKSKLPFLENVHVPKLELPEKPDLGNMDTKSKVLEVIRILCLAIYRLRSLFLAIPVIFLSLRLATYNSEHLPLLVGLDLQTTGEFARTISRQTAVTMPLAITGGCLVLTICSRKPLYPWLISLFSLIIPVMLLFTNLYPA
jgi:hypothetical protein